MTLKIYQIKLYLNLNCIYKLQDSFGVNYLIITKKGGNL